MSSFKEDFESFQLDRLDTAITHLKINNPQYTIQHDEYTKLTNQLFENLSEDKVILFDKIVDLLGGISADECLAVYRIGFSDGLNFKDKDYFYKKEAGE